MEQVKASLGRVADPVGIRSHSSPDILDESAERSFGVPAAGRPPVESPYVKVVQRRSRTVPPMRSKCCGCGTISA